MPSYTEYSLGKNETEVRLAPERGGLVTGLTVGGREVLYLNRETFENPSLSLRGGIPILFPFCGSLREGVFEAAGTRIPQHGFARSMVWRVEGKSDSRMVISIEDTAETRVVWPWSFRIVYTVEAVDGGVEIGMIVENRGDSAMPVSPGWHPYFPLNPVDKRCFATSAPGAGAGCASDDVEINFGVSTPRGADVGITLPGLGGVRLVYTESMRHLQIWTQPGKPFICVEPFDGPPNDVNTAKAPRIGPGARGDWRMGIWLVA